MEYMTIRGILAILDVVRMVYLVSYGKGAPHTPYIPLQGTLPYDTRYTFQYIKHTPTYMPYTPSIHTRQALLPPPYRGVCLVWMEYMYDTECSDMIWDIDTS